MANYLYKYIFSDGMTYIGRSLNTKTYDRAKDHFYNAISFAYNWESSGLGLYSLKSNKSIIWSYSSMQDVDSHWGRLIRSQYATYDLLKKDVIETDINFSKTLSTVLQNDNIIGSTKLRTNASNKVKEHWRSKRKVFNKQVIHANNGHPLEDVIGWQSDNQDKQLTFKSNLTNTVSLKEWKIKQFQMNDPIWQGTYRNPDTGKTISFQILEEFQKAPQFITKFGLNEPAKAAEFLLIALHLTSPTQFANSLNRDIGESQKIYKDMLAKYGASTFVKLGGKTIDKEGDKRHTQIINELTLRFQDKNFIQALSHDIINSSFTLNQKMQSTPIDIDFNESWKKQTYNFLVSWFQMHKSDNYWSSGTEGNVETMLQESFKYTFIMHHRHNYTKNVQQWS